MQRVAVVAPPGAARRAGPGRRRRHRRARPPRAAGPGRSGPPVPRRRLPGSPTPAGSRGSAGRRPDLDLLERAGRADLLAGEAQLEERAAARSRRGAGRALAGWVPAAELPALAARLGRVGGAVVPLPAPPRGRPADAAAGTRGVRPLLRAAGRRPTRRCPTRTSTRRCSAGLAYVVMFGMMFGDAGHGAAAPARRPRCCARAGRARLARLRQAWLFVAGAGLASTFFGLLYGEFFGPTGVVPGALAGPAGGAGHPARRGASASARCCSPARTRRHGQPVAGGRLAAGPVRRRPGSPAPRSSSASGLVAAGWYAGLAWLVALRRRRRGGRARARLRRPARRRGGGGAGATQAVVELFDTVVRLGANVVSFARLAAFGLTHAALGRHRLGRHVALWAAAGSLGCCAAVAVFVVGNALAFALEALVAGVQALRLEYYELFSRVFATEGRPFRPWHVPVDDRCA